MNTSQTAMTSEPAFPLTGRIWLAIFGGLWAVAFVAGLVGLGQRLVDGHKPADYGSYLTWGLWVAAYQYLVEVAAGAFILAAAIYLLRIRVLERIAPVALLLGITSLLAGILMVWIDLGRAERFWRVVFSPNLSSIITWVVFAYGAFIVISLVALWFALRGDLVSLGKRGGWQAPVARFLAFGASDLSDTALQRDRRIVQGLMIVGLIPAVGFSGGEGALFGVVGARPYWNSPIFPIAFLASAMVTAGAVLTVLAAFFLRNGGSTRQEARFLARLTIISLGALLLLQFADYTVAAYASIPAQGDAMDEILTGDYWYSFWLVQLVAGAAIPAAIVGLRGRSPLWLGLAGFLVGAGMMSHRLNAVIPGQILPQLEGIESAFVSARLSFDYFPSAMEWLVTLFVACVAIGLFYVAYELLPLGPRSASANGATTEGGD